jgi:hypothetical protein
MRLDRRRKRNNNGTQLLAEDLDGSVVTVAELDLERLEILILRQNRNPSSNIGSVQRFTDTPDGATVAIRVLRRSCVDTDLTWSLES